MAKKFKSYKKYDYSTGGGKAKKIILISLAVVLALVAAVVLFFVFFGGKNTTPMDPFIAIDAMPSQTVYYVGDKTPSFAGLKIKYVSSDGNYSVFGAESCTFEGFDSTVPAPTQTITVKFKQFTTTFNITILDKAEQDPQGLFTDLSFKTKPKTQYKVGEGLSVDGGVLIKKYADGSTREMKLTYDMVFGFDTSKPGTYKLTVSYMEDANRVNITYDITVTQ